MGPIDVLDIRAGRFTYGSKMGIDATRKWPEEGFTRNWPKLIEMDTETKNRVDAIGRAWASTAGRGKREAGREKAEWDAR